MRGEWRRVGTPGDHVTPVDGSPDPRAAAGRLTTRPSPPSATPVTEHREWGKVDLDERRRRVTEAVDAMTEHRDLLALLLVWEIGKPWRLACADVDRCLDGVRWYVGEIERQLPIGSRRAAPPLPGPVSNIASWNYPMSVQVHAELVQLLAGNAVVAKTPSQGGFHSPDPGPRPHAARRPAGHAAVRDRRPPRRRAHPQRRHRRAGVCRRSGQRPAGRGLAGRHRPAPHARAGRPQHLGHLGLLALAPSAQHLRKGFEYAKQRCTAYPRYVVQRRLFPAFLEIYLPVIKSRPLRPSAGRRRPARPVPRTSTSGR